MAYNIIKFSASWCGQCQVLEMNLRKSGIPYRSIDVDSDSTMAEKCNVRNLPTIIVTDGYSNEVDRFTGIMTVKQIQEKLLPYTED